MGKRKAVIFDIDGTCADGRHRQHFVATKPKNWPAYQKAAPHDARWDGMHFVFEAILKARPAPQDDLPRSVFYDILFVSGRSEDERAVTEQWLADNGFHGYQNLFMRKSQDYREDSIIKEEILDEHILPRYDVVCVFDDRPRVVKMWKRRGLYVLTADQREDMTDF